MQQRTIKKQLILSGPGLHTGKETVAVIKPACDNCGITFIVDGVKIPALYTNVQNAILSTNITMGDKTVNTVEHLMAALSALRIDNVDIELSQSEVPILDGSSFQFLEALIDTGIQYQSSVKKNIKVDEKFELHDGHKCITVYPSDELKIEMSINFDHASIGYQEYSYTHSLDGFMNELAPAKTFCLERDVAMMKQAGLIKGGSVDNALVFGDNGALSAIRFADEPVRHKILDMIGDLHTIGNPILGHFVVHATGHAFTNQFIRSFMNDGIYHLQE